MRQGSYYTPLATEFKDHVLRTPSKNSMIWCILLWQAALNWDDPFFAETTSRFVYASNVVAQSLKSSPVPWLWTGSATGIIRFLDMFAWRTIWVSKSLKQENHGKEERGIKGWRYLSIFRTFSSTASLTWIKSRKRIWQTSKRIYRWWLGIFLVGSMYNFKGRGRIKRSNVVSSTTCFIQISRHSLSQILIRFNRWDSSGMQPL